MEAKVWDVLVIGAGISGLEVANRLGNLGYDILLVEKNPTLGGQAKLYNCKAIGDACTKCNACLVNDKIREILSNKKVVPLVSSFIQDAQKDGGLFKITLKKDGDEVYATSRSLIFCGGFKNYNPLQKKTLAYGKSPNIITALEAESIIRKNFKLVRPSDNLEPDKICFIQCVGSRDKEHPYCSQVCCAYAIRMAKLIKSFQENMHITFFYMDIQTFGRDFQKIFPEIQREFQFIRQIPGELFIDPDEKIYLYAKPSTKIEEMVFDLVILSTGISPPEGLSLVGGFELSRDKDGFLNFKSQEGIFALGGATGPKSISDCILDVDSKIHEIVAYLEGRNG